VVGALCQGLQLDLHTSMCAGPRSRRSEKDKQWLPAGQHWVSACTHKWGRPVANNPLVCCSTMSLQGLTTGAGILVGHQLCVAVPGAGPALHPAQGPTGAEGALKLGALHAEATQLTIPRGTVAGCSRRQQQQQQQQQQQWSTRQWLQ
jgi:hypothetical protein